MMKPGDPDYMDFVLMGLLALVLVPAAILLSPLALIGWLANKAFVWDRGK